MTEKNSKNWPHIAHLLKGNNKFHIITLGLSFIGLLSNITGNWLHEPTVGNRIFLLILLFLMIISISFLSKEAETRINKRRTLVKVRQIKYLWFHRLQLILFLAVLIRFTANLMAIPEINVVFYPVAISLVVYTQLKRQMFLFNMRFYFVTVVFCLFWATPTPGLIGIQFAKNEWLGDWLLALMLLTAINALIISGKVTRSNSHIGHRESSKNY